MALKLIPSKFDHVYWIDLHNNGVLQEVVIVARDGNENIWFIPMNSLDNIDQKRIFKLVTDRSSKIMPLYDVMYGTRLGNGVNALEYFHQLVKLRTPTGQIFDANAGVIGAPVGMQPDTSKVGTVTINK